jgi:hypothetical protein
VNFYIPQSFNRSAAFSLAFHFHGFWTRPEFNPFSQENGDYGSYLSASNKNAILIIAESTGAEATYAKDLSTSAQLDRFFKNVHGVLQSSGIAADDSTPRVLSGHSGAYVLLGNIGDWAEHHAVPALASVRGFALFDSAYGFRKGLVSVLETMRNNGSSAYFSAYNPSNSAGKFQTNLQLKRELGAPKTSRGHEDIRFVQNASLAHMAFMRAYMTEFFDFAL